MSDLVVFTYQSETEATGALQRVASAKEENVQQALISVNDAAVVVKADNGKVKVQQTLESLVKGGRVASGGFWGVLIGLLFGGPLLGALVGMALRSFGNRKVDVGIDNDFIGEISNAIGPGQSALLLLTDGADPETLSQALGDHHGTLYHTSFSADAAQALGDLSADGDVATALEADEA